MYTDIPKSKVYALADAQGRVTRIEGGYTMGSIEDITAWVQVDEGYGDRFNLCQSNYMDKPIMDGRGVHRYKLVDGKIEERTQAEMDADYVPPNETESNATLAPDYEAALIELAGMLDETLTRIDEQDAALIELASIIADGGN